MPIAGAATPWTMEAGLWRNVTREASDYDDGMAAIDAMVDPDRLTERAGSARSWDGQRRSPIAPEPGPQARGAGRLSRYGSRSSTRTVPFHSS